MDFLSTEREGSGFKPTNLKTALHYVYFKDKREKILKSINKLKQEEDISSELASKFTMLFRTDLVVIITVFYTNL